MRTHCQPCLRASQQLSLKPKRLQAATAAPPPVHSQQADAAAAWPSCYGPQCLQVSRDYAERNRQQLKAERAARSFTGSERAPWAAPGSGPLSDAEHVSIGSWRSREDDCRQDARMSLTAPADPRSRVTLLRAAKGAAAGSASRGARAQRESPRCAQQGQHAAWRGTACASRQQQKNLA